MRRAQPHSRLPQKQVVGYSLTTVLSGSARRWFWVVPAVLLGGLLIVLDRANPRIDGERLSVWFERSLAQKYAVVPREKADPFCRAGRRGAEWLARELYEQPSYWARAHEFLFRHVGRWVRMPPPAGASRRPRIELARQLLGHFDPTVAAPVLVHRFKSCRKADRAIVAEALAELGPDAAESAGPCLVSLLSSTNSAELAAAILALGEVLYRPEEVVPKLVPFLTNLDTLVRTEASYTLGTYKASPDVTLKPLIERLSDPHEVVKANAARALGRMGTDARPAVDALVAVLRTNRASTRIVPRALEALFSITPDVFPVTQVEMDQWVATNAPADPYFRAMAETARERLGFHEPNLTSDCLGLVKSPKAYIRWEALERLGQCGHDSQEVRAALTAGLSDPNGLVRHTARQALDQWNRRQEPAAAQ